MVLIALAVASVSRLTGQTVTLSGSFTGATLDSGWTTGGSGYAPVLTASAAGGNTDAVGSGWLQMTSNGGNQATYAYDTNSFAAAHATITGTFNYSSFNGTGADGITFFLADASKTFGVGAYGGSLGYAQKTSAGGGGADINGMNGGYIGVGIDEFGNFSNPSEGRIGGTGFTPNSIAVRGPGQGLTGYNYLGGTGNLGTNSIAFPGSSTRPTGANLRTIQIVITATNQMTVYMASGGSGNFVALYSIDLSGYTRPNSLIMGFTSGTGGSTDVHQVQSVALASVASNLWTNVGGNSAWTTANNWNNSPASVPASGADILFDNTFVGTAQNITVAGNQIVRNVQIDAPFSYTLSGGSIELNGSSAAGPSGIFVTQTHGSATQTINSNLTVDNAIQIQNNSSGALALNGTINLQSFTATLNGSGATTLSGVVSGTGAIVQSGTGSTTLSGANTYSGNTTLSGGTLTANNATALGTGSVAISGGTLSSTNGSTVGNILTVQGNSTFSGITTTGNLTQTGGSYTLNLANATESGTVKLSNNNTAQTLTVQVDSGNSTISGSIQNGGTGAGNLTKTGSGNLILSGADTYTGTTTITSGSIVLGTNNVLANTSAMSVDAAGTLNLNGFSQQIGNLTALAGGATIDFGTANTANTFVFGTYTPPASGVLVVNNFVSGTDTLATTIKASSQGTNGSQTINNSIYISGYGLATEAASTSATLYGSAYLLTPAVANTNEWKGAVSANWNNGGNWNSGSKPTTGQIALFNTLGTAQPNVTLNGSNTISGVQFGNQTTTSYNITGANTLTLSSAIPYIQQQSSKDQTLSPSAISISNTTVVDITGAGNLTIGANITGGNSTVNLLKSGSGAGKLILTGNNTGLTGSVYVNSGIVQAGNTTALGANTTYVSGGAALELSGGITPTNAISVAGTGVSGGGALHNVNGSNTLSGTVTETADTTIAADSGTTLNLTGTLTGTNTNTTFAGAGNISVSPITTGTGNVILAGTGTTTFSGAANSYTGATTVNSGTLTLAKAANTTAVAGNLTINGGTVNENASGQIASTATVTLNSGTLALASGVTNTFSTITSGSGSTLSLATGATATISSSSANLLSGNITGAGALATSGTGSVTLGGTNSYSGGTTVASIVTPITNTAFGTGTVAVNSGGSIETQNTISVANNFTLNSTGTTSYNGAIENISGNTTLSGTVTLAGNSRIQSDAGTLTASGTVALAGNTLNVGGYGNTTISAPITGSAASSLTKDGTGTLALAGNNNTFAGSVLISAGTVIANAANVFNSSNAITVNTGSILNTNDFNQTIKSITSSGTLALGAGTGDTLTLSSGTSLLGGSITGAGTIIVGPGATLTLNASFNAPGVNIVLNGGTLNLNGTSDTFGNLSITGNSILDFGSSSASTLNSTNFSLTAGVGLSVTGWTNTSDYFYTQNFTGAVANTRGTTPENQITFSGFSANSTAWQSYDHQITPAPEPATYGAIFVGASLGLILWRRRNKSTVAVR